MQNSQVAYLLLKFSRPGCPINIQWKPGREEDPEPVQNSTALLFYGACHSLHCNRQWISTPGLESLQRQRVRHFSMEEREFPASPTSHCSPQISIKQFSFGTGDTQEWRQGRRLSSRKGESVEIPNTVWIQPNMCLRLERKLMKPSTKTEPAKGGTNISTCFILQHWLKIEPVKPPHCLYDSASDFWREHEPLQQEHHIACLLFTFI